MYRYQGLHLQRSKDVPNTSKFQVQELIYIRSSQTCIIMKGGVRWDSILEVSMIESLFQRSVIKIIRDLFPGCIVLKNDPTYLQGVPDIIILFNDRWAMLEFKRSRSASKRPNQEYYVDLLDSMSFASFISPDNEEEVLYDLQHALGVGRPTRIS